MRFDITDEEREANYRAKMERNKALAEQEELEARQKLFAEILAKQAQKNIENDRIKAMYEAYKNSVRYQQILSFSQWYEQFQLNCLSASW